MVGEGISARKESRVSMFKKFFIEKNLINETFHQPVRGKFEGERMGQNREKRSLSLGARNRIRIGRGKRLR